MKKKSDYDYFLFTNIPKEDFNTSWNIINIDFPEISNSIIKSRIPKFQPWKIDLFKNSNLLKERKIDTKTIAMDYELVFRRIKLIL